MLNICLSMPLQSRDTLICPECVARVPVSLWGSGGWSCVRQTLRNRSREARMAAPMASFARLVTFGGFRRRVALFRMAGVALCDIPTCFITCQKSFCVAGSPLNTPLPSHPTLSTPPSSGFHSLQCTGTATGEKCTRLFKSLVSQKCFTWLHSGSWAAFCFNISTSAIEASEKQTCSGNFAQ